MASRLLRLLVAFLIAAGPIRPAAAVPVCYLQTSNPFTSEALSAMLLGSTRLRTIIYGPGHVRKSWSNELTSDDSETAAMRLVEKALGHEARWAVIQRVFEKNWDAEFNQFTLTSLLRDLQDRFGLEWAIEILNKWLAQYEVSILSADENLTDLYLDRSHPLRDPPLRFDSVGDNRPGAAARDPLPGADIEPRGISPELRAEAARVVSERSLSPDTQSEFISQLFRHRDDLERAEKLLDQPPNQAVEFLFTHQENHSANFEVSLRILAYTLLAMDFYERTRFTKAHDTVELYGAWNRSFEDTGFVSNVPVGSDYSHRGMIVSPQDLGKIRREGLKHSTHGDERSRKIWFAHSIDSAVMFTFRPELEEWPSEFLCLLLVGPRRLVKLEAGQDVSPEELKIFVFDRVRRTFTAIEEFDAPRPSDSQSKGSVVRTIVSAAAVGIGLGFLLGWEQALTAAAVGVIGSMSLPQKIAHLHLEPYFGLLERPLRFWIFDKTGVLTKWDHALDPLVSVALNQLATEVHNPRFAVISAHSPTVIDRIVVQRLGARARHVTWRYGNLGNTGFSPRQKLTDRPAYGRRLEPHDLYDVMFEMLISEFVRDYPTAKFTWLPRNPLDRPYRMGLAWHDFPTEGVDKFLTALMGIIRNLPPKLQPQLQIGNDAVFVTKAGKAQAAEHFVQTDPVADLGINWETMIAIGDDAKDYDLLKTAIAHGGLGISVGATVPPSPIVHWPFRWSHGTRTIIQYHLRWLASLKAKALLPLIAMVATLSASSSNANASRLLRAA